MRWRVLRSFPRFGLKLGILCVLLTVLLLVFASTASITFSRLVPARRQSQKDGWQARMIGPREGDYFLENPFKSDFSRGQSKIIDNLLQEKENGFFVDIGAGNGETNSVSLYFERERQWTGIMVEASEAKHQWSILKNRQCQMWNLRIIFDDRVNPVLDDSITTHQLFEMINRTSIDLLSVNLHGHEVDLLNNIDFVKYHIRVITIELQSDVSREQYLEIKDTLLATHGYDVAHHVVNSFQGKRDVICVKV